MEYNEIKQEFIELLQKKHDMLSELLRVTKLVDLTGDNDKFQSEADDFVFLMEKREKMLNEITSLNDKILSSRYSSFANSDDTFSKEVNETVSKTDELINDIMRLDKLNNVKASAIFNKLKNSIKEINMGKSINTAYQPELDYNDGGFYNYRS